MYLSYHSKPIIATAIFVFVFCCAAGILAAVIASRIEGRDAERYEVEYGEPPSAPEEVDQSRQSFLDPDRDPFLRRLPAGHHASEEVKTRYRELTGNELPDGYTVVRRWLYETAA